MPEQKKTTDKKLSLHPLDIEEALKGLLVAEPPKEKQEKMISTERRQQRKKKTEQLFLCTSKVYRTGEYFL